jgi:hexosaminidase
MKRLRTIILNSIILLSLNSGYAESHSVANTETEFSVVGFHLDLRIQVMKPEALKAYANELASFGINTLIMEWEATFPFETHPLIPNRHAYTKAEINEFIAHCKKLGIEVVPLQQCLGHLEYVLQHARYAEQREDQKDVSQICPLESKLNKQLFIDLFEEMASMHPSKYFHIGGDEAYLFGQCKHCSKAVEQGGKAKLLADHLQMVCEIVVSMGKVPVLWADIAQKYPDELSQLPKETIFLVWNYGWALDRFGDPTAITKKGFEVWGAPALRSAPDNFFLTRWEYHLNNIRDFIPLCRNSGYNGMIMTSWSTSGVYSEVREDKLTISDLVPVRNVYPISGFRILVAAYAQAVQQAEGLDVEAFIVSYCNDRFGFSNKQSLQFWNALQGMPYEVFGENVVKQKDMTVLQMLESAREGQTVLNDLTPKSNTEEFEHFRLMQDIRENYLAFKEIEAVVHSDAFTNRMIPDLLIRLKIILNKDDAIKVRFIEMNSSLLYPSQIEEENQVRIKRVRLLYDRLAKTR